MINTKNEKNIQSNMQSYLSTKIECWILLNNRRIIKTAIPYEKKEFRCLNETYIIGDKYFIRTFKLLRFIPITRLCLFYSQNSPHPLDIKSDGTVTVTPSQITTVLQQGGHYAKMLQETPFDILMQKIQLYGTVGCLIVSLIVALRVFGVFKT